MPVVSASQTATILPVFSSSLSSCENSSASWVVIRRSGGSSFFGPGSPYINLFDTCDQWDGRDFDNRICATCHNKQMLYPFFACQFKPKNASS
jgi:hypothetical protein